ncbi:hypothetical protein VTO42DRAFT_4690 [Malbranchea cinnamomea]
MAQFTEEETYTPEGDDPHQSSSATANLQLCLQLAEAEREPTSKGVQGFHNWIKEIDREIDQFQEDTKMRLDSKTLYTFNRANYLRTQILGDAQLIDAEDILLQEQLEPSKRSTELN